MSIENSFNGYSGSSSEISYQDKYQIEKPQMIHEQKPKAWWYWFCDDDKNGVCLKPYNSVHNQTLINYYEEFLNFYFKNKLDKLPPLKLIITGKIYLIEISINQRILNQYDGINLPLKIEGSQSYDKDKNKVRSIIFDNPDDLIASGLTVKKHSPPICPQMNKQDDEKDKKITLIESSPWHIGRSCNGHCGNGISFALYFYDIVLHDITSNIFMFQQFQEYLVFGDVSKDLVSCFYSIKHRFWEDIITFLNSYNQYPHLKCSFIYWIVILKLKWQMNHKGQLLKFSISDLEDNIKSQVIELESASKDAIVINKVKKILCLYQMMNRNNNLIDYELEINRLNSDQIEAGVIDFCYSFDCGWMRHYDPFIDCFEKLFCLTRVDFWYYNFPCFQAKITNGNDLTAEIITNGFGEILDEAFDKINEKYDHPKHRQLEFVLTYEEILAIYLFCNNTQLCSNIRRSHYYDHDACKWYLFSKILQNAIRKLMVKDKEFLDHLPKKLYHGLVIDEYYSKEDILLKKRDFRIKEMLRMGTFLSCSWNMNISEEYGAIIFEIDCDNFNDFIKYEQDNRKNLAFQFGFADVSWISPYTREAEVLLTPAYFQLFAKPETTSNSNSIIKLKAITSLGDATVYLNRNEIRNTSHLLNMKCHYCSDIKN